MKIEGCPEAASQQAGFSLRWTKGCWIRVVGLITHWDDSGIHREVKKNRLKNRIHRKDPSTISRSYRRRDRKGLHFYRFPLIPLKKAGLEGQRKTIITSLTAHKKMGRALYLRPHFQTLGLAKPAHPGYHPQQVGICREGRFSS